MPVNLQTFSCPSDEIIACLAHRTSYYYYFAMTKQTLSTHVWIQFTTSSVGSGDGSVQSIITAFPIMQLSSQPHHKYIGLGIKVIGDGRYRHKHTKNLEEAKKKRKETKRGGTQMEKENKILHKYFYGNERQSFRKPSKVCA